MKQTLAVLIFITGMISGVYAQETDTAGIKNQVIFRLNKISDRPDVFNAPYSNFIIPAVMVSYGLVARRSKSLQKRDHSINHEISEHLKVTIPIDDYSQYIPAVAVYGMELTGMEAKHNFRDRTVIMATSGIIMGATVLTVKSATRIKRPDGSNNRSFPSGHTAMGFAVAHILFKEYKDTSPWACVTGYAVAAGTGTFRVLNKKHWVSDVVTGAAIGILSAEMGYLLLPVFHNIFGIKNKNNSPAVAPAIGADTYGIGLTYTF